MLVYNQAGDWIWEQAVPEDWDKLFDLYGPRFFAEVDVTRTGKKKLPLYVRRLREQFW